jgi:carboxymethylenebutenolidase
MSSYDSDAAAVIDHLAGRPDSTGKIGTMGMCIGGHLAFRAAFDHRVRAAVCLYATDLHKASLGAGMNDDTLKRANEIRGEVMMIWGRQDPHIPGEGRRVIYSRLVEAELHFTWHEFNGAHAFIRDEGPRYDPALTRTVFGLAFELFYRRLGEGEGEGGSGAAGVTAC